MRNYAMQESVGRTAAPSFTGRAWNLFGNWQARRAVRSLRDVDEHLLADIGVTREEIEWAAGLPLQFNPAVELERRAHHRRQAAFWGL